MIYRKKKGTKKIQEDLYIVSKRSKLEIEKFFLFYVNKNVRLYFNYFNFLYKNKDNKSFFMLNQYFKDKNLYEVVPYNFSLPFNIMNIHSLAGRSSALKNVKMVSVIVTAFNVQEYIEIAIKSLINQTYNNIEVVLIDDKSSDATFEILEKFKNLYPEKITLIQLKKNHGTYIAKNIGISYANGDLITFHDGDDWAHPQRIEEHVKVHMGNKNIKFSISKLVRLTENGFLHAKEIYPIDRLSMVSLMLDKEILNRVGYFRTHRLGSDTEYFERLKKFTKYKWKRIDKVLMFCAHRKNSLTTSQESGVKGFSKNNKREHYWNQWHKWHNMLKKIRKQPFIDFNRDKYEHEIIE